MNNSLGPKPIQLSTTDVASTQSHGKRKNVHLPWGGLHDWPSTTWCIARQSSYTSTRKWAPQRPRYESTRGAGIMKVLVKHIHLITGPRPELVPHCPEAATQAGRQAVVLILGRVGRQILAGRGRIGGNLCSQIQISVSSHVAWHRGPLVWAG